MKRILISIGTFLLTFIGGILIVSGIMGNYGRIIQVVSILLATIICIAFYLLPSIIAKKRNNPNFNTVLILNLLFGWTLFGWVIALLKAMQTTQKVTFYVKNK